MYRARRQLMSDSPGVSVSDLLAAREDEAIMEAVSGAGARRHTRTSINKAALSRQIDQIPTRDILCVSLHIPLL